jgi:hypothetical protein
MVQRAALGEPAGEHPLDDETAAEITRIRGGGRPLDPAARRTYEPVLGADLGQVRVHTGPAADALTRRVAARAFSVGHDVVVPERELRRPDSSRLLAHELAHTLQQRGSAGAGSIRRDGALRTSPEQKAQKKRLAREREIGEKKRAELSASGGFALDDSAELRLPARRTPWTPACRACSIRAAELPRGGDTLDGALGPHAYARADGGDDRRRAGEAACRRAPPEPGRRGRALRGDDARHLDAPVLERLRR